MDTINMFTKDEQVILKNVSSKYKWIARDSDGTLFLFNKKPAKYTRNYGVGSGFLYYFRLEPFEDIFKGVTWDGGPVQFRKDVLDETERKYLKAVLRPFRNRVVRVVKIKLEVCSDCYLRVELKNGDHLSFPSFPEGTMYNGMKLYREYTLEELGINY